MRIQGRSCRTIRIDPSDDRRVLTIDQRRLPFEFVEAPMRELDDAVAAISDMMVRGAPLIGVTGAYGLYLALLDTPRDDRLEQRIRVASERLKRARPTAVNLAWAVDRVAAAVLASDEPAATVALRIARLIEEEDVDNCRSIGEHGLRLIEEIAARKPGEPVNILTHCNAGWLACVDYGTATSPIYVSHERGIPLHVWVDETRPRNQGARLTAWELAEHGVPHTLVVDNAGGHLMQHGMVDLVIVGSDRTTVTGDVCNKIGTYLKALAAQDNAIPFYAAVPSSTIDWTLRDGVREIPIEERDPSEVRQIEGMAPGATAPSTVAIVSDSTPVANFGFDVTPGRLVTGLITERGICAADEEGILALFPEHRRFVSSGDV